MALSRISALNLLWLVGLAGAVQAWAEGAPLPTGLTPILALLAWEFNERRAVVRLQGLTANLLAIAVIAFPAIEFFGPQEDARLLAGAHLLVYLQWLLLFSPRTIQQSWWICALSVLQFSVAAVLTNSAWYGSWMALYLVSAIWTLCVLTLHSAELRFAAFARDLSPRPGANGRAEPAPPERNMFAPAQLGTARGTIQLDPHSTWITPRFVGGVVGMSGASLLLGMLVFLLIPRIWIGSLQQSVTLDGELGATSGFSERVRLGKMGEILESYAPAFDVRFVEQGRVVPIEEFVRRYGFDEPLFRGSVLASYDQGQWRPHRGEGSEIALRPADPEAAGIEQHYRIDAPENRVLFVLEPVAGGKMMLPQHRLILRPESQTFRLGAQTTPAALEYVIQSPRDPRSRPLTEGRVVVKGPYLALPDGLTALRMLAVQVAGWRPGPASEKELVQRARRLEAHLRDSDTYAYSLKMTVVDPARDPIEDFLFNTRAGHCEYFATSLALMLRAVDVPSRLVVGYKGGVPLANGRWLVQQRHAHAWVEAYLEREWVALDPTPAARDEALQAARDQGLFATMRALSSGYWQSHVLNMSYARQREEIYEPIERLLRQMVDLASNLRLAINWLRYLIDHPEEWFSWRGGLTVFLLLLASWAVFTSVRWILVKVLGALRRGRGGDAAQVVAFYARLQRLLEERGFVRPYWQTQAEFAEEVGRAFAARAETRAAAPCVARITHAFYRVRFGGWAPTAEEAQALEAECDRLASIEPSRPNGNGAGKGPPPWKEPPAEGRAR